MISWFLLVVSIRSIVSFGHLLESWRHFLIFRSWLFVMQHMLSLVMRGEASCSNDWHVDSGASNHVTNHAEWFREMQNLERLSYVEIANDTAHPIAHIGKVPLFMQDG